MIPDEAVEAAMVAFAEAPDRKPHTQEQMQAAWREQMTLALEAAAPHLMAARWSAEYLAANDAAVKEHG